MRASHWSCSETSASPSSAAAEPAGRELAGCRQEQCHDLLAGRIADALVLAALEARRELDLELVGGRARERYLRLDVVAEDLDVAEVVVRVRLAGRQRRGAEVDAASSRERQLVPVQVVARCDLPRDRQLVGVVETGVHRERFVDGQQLARGGRVDRTGAEERRGRQCHRCRPLLRQIAQAEVGAALQSELEVERLSVPAAPVRDRDAELVAIRLLLAEKLVAVRLAAWKSRGPDAHAVTAAVEPEPGAVEVIAFEHVEVEIHALGVGAGRVTEDFLRRQQLLVLRASDARRGSDPGRQHSGCKTRRDHSCVSPSTPRPIPRAMRDSPRSHRRSAVR
jgi:hypothetical protein